MLLPKITNKQQEILKYIYHFRFLNRIQIQTLLNHKDHKLINIWLKDLNEKQYLGRIYTNKFGENTKPAIYYIETNGIKFLRTQDCSELQISKLHREKERSEYFVKSCQLIADIYLDLKSKNTMDVKYKVTTNSGIANPSSPYNFLNELNPKLIIEKEFKDMKKYYLLEIFEPTIPLHSARKRIRNYIDFYFSNAWEENTGAKFPTIILAAETLPMLMTVKKITRTSLKDYKDLEDFEIRFTTLENSEMWIE